MEHVYAITHVVGSSQESIQDAVRNAVRAASRTLRSLEWFEVSEIRGHIADGEVQHFQVVIKLGFRYHGKEDDD